MKSLCTSTKITLITSIARSAVLCNLVFSAVPAPLTLHVIARTQIQLVSCKLVRAGLCLSTLLPGCGMRRTHLLWTIMSLFVSLIVIRTCQQLMVLVWYLTRVGGHGEQRAARSVILPDSSTSNRRPNNRIQCLSRLGVLRHVKLSSIQTFVAIQPTRPPGRVGRYAGKPSRK